MADQEVCYSKAHKDAAEMFLDASDQKLLHVNNYFEIPKDLFESLKMVCGDTKRRDNNKVCRACIKYTRTVSSGQIEGDDPKKRKASQSPEQTTSAKRTESASITFETIVDNVLNFSFTSEQLAKLMMILGSKIAPFIISAAKLSKATEKHVEMISQDTGAFLEGTYLPLKSFFAGIRRGIPREARRKQDDESEARVDRLTVTAIETCMSIVNERYVSSFALAEMLYIYFLSSSSRSCDVHGMATAGGSTKSMQRVITKFAETQPEFPATGYVVVALDNNQKVGKTYHIQLDSKVKSSVVTALSAFHVNDDKFCQGTKCDFGNWHRFTRSQKEELVVRMIDFSKRSEARISKYLQDFLKDRIAYVKESLKTKGPGLFEDDLANITVNERQDVKMNKYVPAKSDICTIYDQTCFPENPSSYANVKNVFDHIQSIALKERRWITVVSDGLPYYIGQEIIRKYVQCGECDAVFCDEDTNDHYTTAHNQPGPSEYLQRKYSNILLRPGAGHYEMNILKSIFNMWFPLLLDPVAEKMGFKTQKAKMYCKKASDHHKSWEMIIIVFESIIDELLYSFLKKNLSRDPNFEANPAIFLDACFKSKNDTTRLASQFAFHWVFPLLVFRAGIRTCNFQASIMAREVAADIFYIQKHPRYQKINTLDLAELQNIPANLRENVYRESLIIKNLGSGQGIDFLLEQRNKVLKNFVICQGVPTSDQWVRASTSLPSLEKIVSKVQQRLKLPDSQTPRSHDLTPEVKATRELFRRNKFCDIFCFTNIIEDLPQDAKSCMKFSDCKSKAVKNKYDYYSNLILHGTARITTYAVEEGQDGVELLTVGDLKKGIREMTNYLPLEDKRRLTKGYSTFRKADLIVRYRLIKDFVTQVPNDDDDSDSD